MSLSNRQLILLDTLAYYSAFSDIKALSRDDTIADIIGYIEHFLAQIVRICYNNKKYLACFVAVLV